MLFIIRIALPNAPTPGRISLSKERKSSGFEIIFATPPMVRLTLLGLRKVSPEVIEAGKMSGCSDFQLLFRVLIPTARRDILIGVNQVIMQCLALSSGSASQLATEQSA